jgi:hypothetical protein
MSTDYILPTETDGEISPPLVFDRSTEIGTLEVHGANLWPEDAEGWLAHALG